MVDGILFGHQDRRWVMGDRCKEVGRRVVDGTFPWWSQCGALVLDDDPVSTFLASASFLQQVG